MDLVLGIDLGTSYFKAGVFDPQGRMRGLGRIATRIDRPADRRAEMPVAAFWVTLAQAVQTALAEANAAGSHVAAVSYSSQANTFLLLDETDQPLTPLILWTDQRSGEVPSSLRALWEREEILRVTGMGIGGSPAMAFAKLVFLKNERPDLWKRVARVATISDYLTYVLTGEATGDQGTAELTAAWDVVAERWWADVLACAGLAEAHMARPTRPGLRGGFPISARSAHNGFAWNRYSRRARLIRGHPKPDRVPP